MIPSEFVPDYDATTVSKLHEAGAAAGQAEYDGMGHASHPEFPYGQPCNPWNVEHDVGGSSTGSGSATAAALCAGALGEDTGGSIRRPAANNSCVDCGRPGAG